MSEQFPTLGEMGAIPWQCWDVPGFKTCHDEAGHITYRQLESVGARSGTPEWNEVYPLLYRRNVRRCEILSNCSQPLLDERLPDRSDESDTLMRLKQQQDEQALMTWGAVAVAGGLLLFFAYKRLKKS